MGGAPIAGGPTGRAPKAGPLGPGGRAPGRPFAVGVGNPASNKIENFSIITIAKCSQAFFALLFRTSTVCGHIFWCNAMQARSQMQFCC